MHFLKEITSREFVDVLVGICTGDSGPSSHNFGSAVVRARATAYAYSWKHLFKSLDGLGYLGEALELAEREKNLSIPSDFPTGLTIDGPQILMTSAPPEWTDSPFCCRCNDSFSLTLRKHHCRRCGRTFCQACSSKNAPLPDLGVYEAVRVCEGCFQSSPHGIKSLPKTSFKKHQENNLPLNLPNSPTTPEEDDLQKALKLSLLEDESSPTRGSQLSQTVTIKDYDEEAALAAAIAASIKDNEDLEKDDNHNKISESPPTTSGEIKLNETNSNFKLDSTLKLNSGNPTFNANVDQFSAPETHEDSRTGTHKMVVTPIERETVGLFTQLVQRMTAEEAAHDPKLMEMASDMQRLLNRLKISNDENSTADLRRLIGSLRSSLDHLCGLPSSDSAAKSHTSQQRSPNTQIFTGQKHSGPDVNRIWRDEKRKDDVDASVVDNSSFTSFNSTCTRATCSDPKVSNPIDTSFTNDSSFITIRPSCPDTYNNEIKRRKSPPEALLIEIDDEKPLIEL